MGGHCLSVGEPSVQRIREEYARATCEILNGPDNIGCRTCHVGGSQPEICSSLQRNGGVDLRFSPRRIDFREQQCTCSLQSRVSFRVGGLDRAALVERTARWCAFGGG